jgi:protein-S-isoprenylcysteine O-methyltransferase Ste14
MQRFSSHSHDQQSFHGRTTWHGVVTLVQASAGLLFTLTGWGFRDLAAFFAEPARTGLVVLIVLAAGVAIAAHIETQPVRKGLLPAGRQDLLLAFLLVLSIAMLVFLPFADRHRLFTFDWPIGRELGLVLCATGACVRLLALRHLGPQFSAYVTLQSNHHLVQKGIYGRVRHPLYLSLLLGPLGIAMVFSSWLSIPIVLAAIIFVADRIHREEKLLEQEFGGEFLAYRMRTQLLIPGLF